MQRINRKKLISDKPLTQTVYSIVNNIPNGYTDEDTNQKYYSKNIKDKKRPNKFLSIQERQKIIREINKSQNRFNLLKSSPLKEDNMKINSNNQNILYGSATNITVNNNLASNSTNSNIGNNNIIFGNSNIGSKKKNSFGNFNFNSKNLKIKNHTTNSLNSAFSPTSENKKLIPENSAAIIRNSLLNVELKPTNDNRNNQEIIHKKIRAVSTAPHEDKIFISKNKDKEKINDKEKDNIKKNGNINVVNKVINTNLSLSNYASATSSALNYKQNNKNDKLSKYEIGHTLGKGAYAIVKTVTNIISQEKFAMKIYEKEKLNDNSKKKCVDREI